MTQGYKTMILSFVGRGSLCRAIPREARQTSSEYVIHRVAHNVTGGSATHPDGGIPLCHRGFDL